MTSQGSQDSTGLDRGPQARYSFYQPDRFPTARNRIVTLRCLLDGLLLDATVGGRGALVTAYDGDEPFGLEAVEALYYEIVTADAAELLGLERGHFRLLRRAADFLLMRA